MVVSFSSSEQLWRNVAFHHLFTNRSSAVNGCRQNESPNSWQKHYNNPQVIHTTPCVLWKSNMFIRNKSIKTFLTLNSRFWPKHKSIIHNNGSSSETVHPLSSSHIKIITYLFRNILYCFHSNLSRSVHISLLIHMRIFFFHCRKQYYG